MLTMHITIALLTALVSTYLTKRFTLPSSSFYIADRPNERSLHVKPTPRGGGIAVTSAYVVALALSWLLGGVHALSIEIILALVALGTISFFDDRGSVSVVARFLTHCAAATMVILSGHVIPADQLIPGLSMSLPFAITITLTLLFTVWMINLYNFMDGMDGFAGGMAVFGFGTFAIAGILSGHYPFALTNLLLVCSVLGFLVFNFPPARIFMGDTGSASLGFLAAGLSLIGANQSVFPFWFAVVVFSPFLVDATVTLVKRLLRGEKIWQAHRSHYYQRLVLLGWSHRKTVLWEYALMAFCSAAALLSLVLSVDMQQALLLTVAAIYISIVGLIEALDRVRTRPNVTAPPSTESDP